MKIRSLQEILRAVADIIEPEADGETNAVERPSRQAVRQSVKRVLSDRVQPEAVTVKADEKKTKRERPAKARRPRSTKPSKTEIDAATMAFLSAVQESPAGLTADELRTKTGLSNARFRVVARRLREQGSIAVEGTTRGARYTAAQKKTEPQALTRVVRRKPQGANTVTPSTVNGLAVA